MVQTLQKTVEVRLRMLPYSSHCLVRSGYMYCVSYGSLDVISTAFFSDSYLFAASPEEYTIWIFWEMTSGIISVLSTLWFDSGYMSLSGY